MQQFIVPQFIDVENKIIGPLTARQFIIIFAMVILLFAFYKWASLVVFIVASIIIVTAGGSVAFVKVNGMPMQYFLVNLLQTFARANVRVWGKTGQGYDKDQDKEISIKTAQVIPQSDTKQRMIPSQLSRLSLLVDTGGMYKGEKDIQIKPTPLRGITLGDNKQ